MPRSEAAEPNSEDQPRQVDPLFCCQPQKCLLAGGLHSQLESRAMPKPSPALPAIGILESLDEDARAALAAAGEVSSLPEGAPLLKQGDQQNRLYFLLDGKLSSATLRRSLKIVE